MWNKLLKETVLEPLLRRVGTMAATGLVAGGDKLCEVAGACGLVTPDGATATVTWVIAAALVAFDLAVSYLEHRKTVAKTAAKLLAGYTPDSAFAPDRKDVVR